MRARPLVTFLIGASTLAALVGVSTNAAAGRACAGDVQPGGYSYAGHQAAYRGHGVRATITMIRAPRVEAGHVAGWIGVGGPGQGANGEDAWIQAGIASTPGTDPVIYAEIARGSGAPEFILVERGVAFGRPHRLAVLEMSGRPGWWRVWVDGRAETGAVRLQGSSGRWAPIATAESWNAGTTACNAFGFRFERISVSSGGGGSWRPFEPGHQFLDGANILRDLASTPAESGAYARTLARRSVPSYAFVAASS